MTNGWRLRPDVRLWIEYGDDTRIGSPISARLGASLAAMFAPILHAAQERGLPYVLERAEALLAELRDRLFADGTLARADPIRITPEVLFPDPRGALPAAMTLAGPDALEGLRVDCRDGSLPVLHGLVAALHGDADATGPATYASDGLSRELVDELRRRGLLLDPAAPGAGEPAGEPSAWRTADATFVGHNTVVVRSATTRVVVDPWLRPRAERYGSYQPTLRAELGRIDAILITHSHPDHFTPSTLLQFGPRTRVVVPRVERESLLAVAMARRLRELGFEDVVTLDWWEALRVGDIEVVALPFYGEQPTTGEQLCPEVRNAGSTYLVRTPRFSCALIADSGRDRDGDVRDVALRAYRRWGAIDVLFGGYRGWSQYPIQYAGSSVRQYLLFVPPDLDTVRQSIMNTASEAVDTAEAWHARYLAPYGDGGAPWYWELGLGPDLGAGRPKDWRYFDPLPEVCLEALAERSAPTADTLVGSPVRPLLLRPGQSIRMIDGAPHVVEVEGHRWPWAGPGGISEPAADDAVAVRQRSVAGGAG